ncbi:MAG TPA: hypothetical protein RMH99_33045 [Sandaracinaceae bacterium LLY-WYZ-13_1]|nr:hypothetical protein [Sandaracinaceae bacterium LLY-WYZ-13_1]
MVCEEEGLRANAGSPRSDSRTKVNATAAPSRSLLLAAAVGVSLGSAFAPSTAEAQPYVDFQQAQDAWARGEYDAVVRLLEPLVGGEIPSRVIRGDRVLVRESRKYLGAAYVLTGEDEHGAEQFEALLRAEGDEMDDYRLEAAVFPSEVHSVFDEVRTRLVRERHERRDELERRREQEEERRRAALLELVDLAQYDEVTLEHDPLLAWVPFGAGQFQNGNEGLGWFFGVAEAATLTLSAASLSTYAALQDLRYCPLGTTCGAGRPSNGLVSAFAGLTWGLGGAFVALAVVGIVEAHLSFVPSHTERREREVPDSILQDLELAAGPGGLTATLTFW